MDAIFRPGSDVGYDLVPTRCGNITVQVTALYLLNYHAPASIRALQYPPFNYRLYQLTRLLSSAVSSYGLLCLQAFACNLCQAALQPMSSDEAAKRLIELPINILLHHVLALLADTPLDIISFGCTCQAAHKLANDDSLWSFLCKGFPWPDPASWNAVNHKQLYLALVLPYSHLLHHLWHSTTWPVGQLIRVDAEPPRLVARSLYFKGLNAGPYCHDVFVVELAPGQVRTAGICDMQFPLCPLAEHQIPLSW